MAKEKDVIKALESSIFLTTRELYSTVGMAYPLIRLVNKGRIKCIIADKNYYFLEQNKDKLPAWLKKGRLAKGLTTTRFDVRNKIKLESSHNINNMDSSLFDPKLSISNNSFEKDIFTERYTDEEKQRIRESYKRYHNKRYKEDEKYREYVKARGKAHWRLRREFKQQVIMQTFQRFCDNTLF
jgi:hypothetical protein